MWGILYRPQTLRGILKDAEPLLVGLTLEPAKTADTEDLESPRRSEQT